ncbi:hypothetical protein Hanom_Chr01g00028481 [Helianthus anomalus]
MDILVPKTELVMMGLSLCQIFSQVTKLWGSLSLCHFFLLGDKVKMEIWGSKPRSAMKRQVAATDDGGVKISNPCNR